MTYPTCKATSVGITLSVIGGKWKLLILWHLHSQTLRFGELQSAMKPITTKMLTQQLRELEKDGLVSRKIYPEIPPKVEYSMTTYAKTLEPILKQMADWGSKHIKRT